jgi:single-stranded-DNA-specific exonuclease
VSPVEALAVAAARPARRQWILPEKDGVRAAELAHAAGLPLLISELLLERGITTAADAELFLHPRMDALLDPYSMHGMDGAVRRIQSAIRDHECILIYGDYDVDGTVAIVLLKTAIEMLGGEVRFHVPHRLLEGYGMQRQILADAAASGVRLVISVDTGIRAFAEAEAARELGMDLIVTDHHLPEASMGLPMALAVLNPNQPNCGYACKHLCGAGVAFKVAQALLEAWDRERARTKILPSFLKMLAVATVADAVPLVGENRVFAAIGLEELRRPVNAGLRALMTLAKLDPARRKLTTTDLGFRLAPRINAAGRMDVASEVVELFTTRDQVRALELATKLDRLNTDRRQAELTILTEMGLRLKTDEFRDARCIVMIGDGWHRGIIGILGSRIVDQTGKPAIVVTRENGEAYGSGRSVEGFHLLNAIESCHDLFTRFGGHAHAVGFSLPSERVPELQARIAEYAAIHVTAACLLRPLACHAELPLNGITRELHGWLRKLEPMGMGNEEPVFIARSVRLATAPRIIKDRHVKLQLMQNTGSAAWSALGWNWAERVAAMEIGEGSIIDVAYRLRENEHPEYGGLELEITDLQPVH